MARKAYVYIDDIPKKVTKAYVGIGNVASKIRKAYIGIGGVARPCWGGILSYYGKITDLSVGRRFLAATTVGDYALFGGGSAGDNYYANVDAYNSSLTRTIAEDLKIARCYLAATTVDDYALFGGGYNPADTSTIYTGYIRDVTAYNSSLTRATISTSLWFPKSNLSATTVGNYAIFAGGAYRSDATGALVGFGGIDVYSSSLVNIGHMNQRHELVLTRKKRNLAATTVGNYAIFAGGYASDSSLTPYNDADAFDSSLTHTIPQGLDVARRFLAATTVGNYALFAGGQDSSSKQDAVDIYDSSLTKLTSQKLSRVRSWLAATTVGDYALFAGGNTGGVRKIVDAFDSSLTHTIAEELSVARESFAATTIDKYALFAGGKTGDNYTSTVEAYTI